MSVRLVTRRVTRRITGLRIGPIVLVMPIQLRGSALLLSWPVRLYRPEMSR